MTLAGFDRGDLGADFLDEADVLVSHRVCLADRLQTAPGPQVRTAHSADSRADDRVGRVENPRVVQGFEADIAGGVDHCSAHEGPFDGEASGISGGRWFAGEVKMRSDLAREDGDPARTAEHGWKR